MAKATSKTILFGTATHNKVRRQWPIAVFANAGEARSYVTFLKLAYRSNDLGAIKALDPQHYAAEDGTPVKDTKWSVTTVPYAPLPELDESDSADVPETQS